MPQKGAWLGQQAHRHKKILKDYWADEALWRQAWGCVSQPRESVFAESKAGKETQTRM